MRAVSLNDMKSYFKIILISLVLTVILAASNTYLALKIGILPSASIPAAILAMGILKRFKHSTLVENTLIQTAASAGQAVVGGIVYTAPALIMIHYWFDFPYWQCVIMSFIGGSLGVLLSIPLRKQFVSDPNLPFPEGKAIATVLQASELGNLNLRKVIIGASLGGLIDLFQSGFKVLAEEFHYWVIHGQTILGFSTGFSTAMIGTGYLMGMPIGGSLLLGGVIGWIIGIPALSTWFGVPDGANTSLIAMNFWNETLRYISLGAMLFAGLFSLTLYMKSFVVKFFSKKTAKIVQANEDLSNSTVILGILFSLASLFILFHYTFNLTSLPITTSQQLFIIGSLLVLILIIGFVFSTICAYFSGLLGVSGSPGSGIIVSGALIIAVLVKGYFNVYLAINLTDSMLLTVEAMIIIVTAILACIAAIAIDNIQDLKVGHLMNAKPWQQQLMLLFGIFIVSLIAPLIMQLLLHVYGIVGDVQPHLDPSQTLSAPPAAMIASLVDAIFQNTISWKLIGAGALFIILLIGLNHYLNRNRIQFSILAIATGMYLPLTITVPLFIGSLLSFMIERRLTSHTRLTSLEKKTQLQSGFLMASGMLCGATLMQIILAGIFAVCHNVNALSIMPANMTGLSYCLSIMVTGLLFYWMYRKTSSSYTQ